MPPAIDTAMPSAMARPMRPARRALCTSPAPSQKLMRALVAMPSDNGTMYATAVRLAAI